MEFEIGVVGSTELSIESDPTTDHLTLKRELPWWSFERTPSIMSPKFTWSTIVPSYSKCRWVDIHSSSRRLSRKRATISNIPTTAKHAGRQRSLCKSRNLIHGVVAV